MSRRTMIAALALVSAASFAATTAHAQSHSIIPQQTAAPQESGVAPTQSPLAVAPSAVKKGAVQSSGAVAKGVLTPTPAKK